MSGIVVGVDHTATARRAAFKGAEIAKAMGEPLRLVMALKSDRSTTLQNGTDQFFASWVTNGSQFLERLSIELGVEDTTISVGVNNPAKAICEQARHIDARMIVVGNRRVQGATRVLGSIATDVTRHAHCDVLVAHTSDASDESSDAARYSATSA